MVDDVSIAGDVVLNSAGPVLSGLVHKRVPNLSQPVKILGGQPELLGRKSNVASDVNLVFAVSLSRGCL